MDLFELTTKLIAIPSVTGDEKAVGEFLSAHLESLGYNVQQQEVETDRFNVIATTDVSPRVVLSTHMDTVPPHIPSSENKEWIFGRGRRDSGLTPRIGREELGCALVETELAAS